MEITIDHLVKTYNGKVRAISDVSLTIPSGMFGLLGPNGAGKTTLMRILAGILYPTSGAIHMGSIDATTERGRKTVKQVLGYLPQELGVYPDLTAREFMDYIGLLKGLHDKRARQQRVSELLAIVGLTDVANRRLRGFSGGMKRRVGIAQALLNDPQLLIVDEPTAGLDPEERIRFRNLLVELGGNRTVILSTHIVEDIAQTCQRVAVLMKGQVVFQGGTSQLANEAQGKVWQVVTSGPRPDGQGTILATMPLADGTRYRILGEQPTKLAEAVAPTLEDGYMTLMEMQRASAALR